jgi:hypothetical protein
MFPRSLSAVFRTAFAVLADDDDPLPDDEP